MARSVATLIGRARELAGLGAAVSDLCDGRGGLHLIAGEPGIGKTSLLLAVEEHLRHVGALALWGRCWEGGGAPAYWPWQQVLRAVADASGGPAAAVQAAGGSVELLRHVLPELQTEGRGPSRTPGDGLDDPRFALFDSVLRLLRQRARSSPLALLLEDLHAADVPSLLLLGFVAQQARTTPLLVVATYRDVEGDLSQEHIGLLADIGRSGQSWPLGGLTDENVGELIRVYADEEPSARLRSAVREATAGNPLFVREVVGQLRREGDSLDAGAHFRPPPAIKVALQRRYALLPPRAQEVLEAASVLGREFGLNALERISGFSAEEVGAGLAAAQEVSLVREVQTGVRWAFVHGLMREAVYDRIPRARAESLHARALRWLQESSVGALGLVEMAHHALAALRTVGPIRCSEVLLSAADAQLEVLGFEHAADLYERALAVLDDAGLPPPTRVLLRLASARMAAGRVDEAREVCLRAAAQAREAGDAEGLAQAALVYGEPGTQGGLVDDQHVAMLEEGLEALPSVDDPLRCKLLSRLALELYFGEEGHRRDELSRDALLMSARLDDAGARALALRARFMASWTPDNAAERLALADELKELARQARDPLLAMHAEARRITCLLELGRVTELDAAIETHRCLAESSKHAFHVWTSKTILGMRALMEGRLADTERLAKEAYEIGWERMHLPNAIFAYFNQTLSAAYERGTMGDEVDTLRGLSEGYPRLRALACLLVIALLETESRSEAEDRFQECRAAFPTWPRDSNWLHAVGWFAECAWRLQDQDAAALAYEAVRAHAGRIQLAGMPHPVTFWGSTSRTLALMAAVRGEWQQAETHFEAALAEHRAFGARGYTARTEQEFSQMLSVRSAPGDAARAGKLLSRSTSAARSMGMRALEGRATGANSAASPRVAPAPARMRRVGDGWAIDYGAGGFRMRSNKGLEHIAKLVARPGEEVLALDLMAVHSRARSASAEPLPAGQAPPCGGALGAPLDDRAKQAYRLRLAELRDDLDEADRWGDAERATRAQLEIDAIAHELAAAFGLGGRARVVGSDSERARIAVTKVIKSAIRRVTALDPVVGRYLTSTIRTGTFCAYDPDPGNSLLGGLTIA